MGPIDKQSDHDPIPRRTAAADARLRWHKRKQPGERRDDDDRRVLFDRRDMIRFEADRRAGFDRRVDANP